nr:MAG TPA: phosphoadenosine-phosphosulfate reductase [Caudoviricetes sp.]
MKTAKKDEFRSRVYTDRPAYADFEPAAKFEAIKSIIARRLKEHPNAVCSYSGGSDSDIMIDLIETVRKIFNLPPVHYCFFQTGLEMEATKRHVKETAEKYGVEIHEYRPKKNIVLSTREHGLPFVSKIMSQGLEGVQKKGIPLSIADEYAQAEDKAAKRRELSQRYPKCESTINFLCCCNSAGEPRPNIQLVINSSKYMLDFIKENPIPFKVSNHCCTDCKKNLAHSVQKSFDMVITGERRDEGGMRSVPRSDSTTMCFSETASGQYRLRPLYYVSDADKAWYKEYHKIRYSDAYEVYGLTRTGCCGCSISARAVEDLERIRPYEPNLVKAAWKVFGPSYLYRQQYNGYKARRMAEDKAQKAQANTNTQATPLPGQMEMDELMGENDNDD